MRRLVLLAVLLALAGSGCGANEEGYQHFRSRPDLTPPVVNVRVAAQSASPGYVFIAPKQEVAQAGSLILDDTGQVVWFQPLDTQAIADFRLQHYHGEPVLTWWRGRATKGVGDGYDVIVDRTYRELARVRAGNGLAADIHEFLISPEDTALITVYHRVPMDLTPVGGPPNGSVLEGIVQEVDIGTGEVLFEWHSAAEIGIDESYANPPPANRKASAPYDYFHINSVDVEPDGNLLVSARNTHALYEIDRLSGAVRWRLGGKKSDFAMGPGTRFAWQHDARRHADGTISLFDNEADPPYAKRSRALVLRLDTAAKTAALVRSYHHPDGLLSGSQGNVQFLSNGHVLVGWGANPNVTEYDRDGQVVFDASFKEGADSYRAYRFEWDAAPPEQPALAVLTDRRGRVTAYASWNGATAVAGWEALAGPDESNLREVATAPRAGFETAIPLGWLTDRYVAVRALAADGSVLAASALQRRPSR